ncbi:hypothetical protein F2Q69_00014949 [Brassica cretica]|uniref:Uncharacterized protein n=1 Tax=Brassica cretica TaxID=69181 RepID=A0A8S9R531_BRACR|nr:hypothetical protein F2Q69_00014949 [Brassica cretica]
MRRVHATWQELIGGVFFVDGSETRVSRSVSHFLFFLFVLGFLRLRGDFSYDDDAEAFLHLIDGGLSSPQMDPAEERREMKRQKEHYIMLQCAADTQYGIPTRCLCGSRISKNFEIERLTKRVKESEEVILLVAKLNKQIDTLEEQFQDLTVKVHVLEKLCFD